MEKMTKKDVLDVALRRIQPQQHAVARVLVGLLEDIEEQVATGQVVTARDLHEVTRGWIISHLEELAGSSTDDASWDALQALRFTLQGDADTAQRCLEVE